MCSWSSPEANVTCGQEHDRGKTSRKDIPTRFNFGAEHVPLEEKLMLLSYFWPTLYYRISTASQTSPPIALTSVKPLVSGK
ncbi:hypothetical protein Y032_0006g3102 [Ancylostoma ceylanicum]|uniref:Uncharacterized protein n=1 Tax=Ancylostoma ceylanicum TaxID=53326 RepID=A0A016VQ09_9BILA|nr:hypothetical protein Y032_0006g3102 [Ancylostoma ceylanicum]